MRARIFPALVILALSLNLYGAEIHEAAESGDLTRVKSLLAENPRMLESRNDGGYTPLLSAAKAGQIGIFQFLLDKGADLYAVNNRGSSALNLAAFLGKIEMIKYLLNLGFEVDNTTMTGFTPLLHAASNRQTEAVRLLLEEGANLNIFDSTWGGSAIHWACSQGNDDIRDLLLSKGADINARCPTDSSTPIFWAAQSGNIDAIKWLVAHGIKPNDVELNGWTPLHTAVMQQHPEMVKYLMDIGADFNAGNQGGTTPVLLAAQSGNMELVRLFIERGADVNYHSVRGETMLQAAIFSDNVELIKLLIDEGADVNTSNEMGMSALSLSATQGRTDVASLLLDGGAQINTCDREGYSPLINSIIMGHDEISELLINNGADLQTTDGIYGRTGLHWAAIKGNLEISKGLLENGSAINDKDYNGYTPLYYAGYYGNKDLTEYLKSKGGVTDNRQGDLERLSEINQEVGFGDARVWYLGHCGFALKTANNLLIFDYNNQGKDPAFPSLINGHINPDEIKDQNVFVFVSHEHQDHFDTTIYSWDKAVDNCTYIFGFRPEDLPQYRESRYTGPEYKYIGPREEMTLDGMGITTIESNDAGVGFLVKVDGLEIYFAGDHAGWRAGRQEYFAREIDFLGERISNLDLAFVNATGCHVQDTIALEASLKYTLENLHPKLWFPTHGLDHEYVYNRFAAKAQRWNLNSKAFCAENRGDMIYYKKEGI